jgi:phosphoglycerol transferase
MSALATIQYYLTNPTLIGTIVLALFLGSVELLLFLGRLKFRLYRPAPETTSPNLKLIVITMTLLLINAILGSAMAWLHHSFPGAAIEAILFTLQTPLKGLTNEIIQRIFIHLGIIAGLASLCLVHLWFFRRQVIQLFWRGRQQERRLATFSFVKAMLTANLILLLFMIGQSYISLRIGFYFKYLFTPSNFIAEHYVDPRTANLQFPQPAKNLVFISVESLEAAYHDLQLTPGGQHFDLMPELTALAQTYTNFSPHTGLGGMQELILNSWTLSAQLGQTAGLPLKITDNSLYSRLEDFLPGVVTLGDLLAEQGYQTAYFTGADGAYAGEAEFFSLHQYQVIKDLSAFRQSGQVPADYQVWWGIEDKKLFAFAREQILTFAANQAPFYLFISTLDTHNPEGYLDPDCPTPYSQQYANVIACTSRQIADFVTWLQAQVFYPETVIVIAGDHKTPNNFFMGEYFGRRTIYDVFINAAPVATASVKNRQFSALDIFPTTLASLGVKIPGHQLGLGVNLFSGASTLLERYGLTVVDEELLKQSTFYHQQFVLAPD